MKTIVKGALLLAAVSMIAVGCKKYDDGPGFSLKSKKGRLAGTWTIDRIVDASNTESQDQINQEWTFTKEGDFSWDSNITSTAIEGTWNFDDKKENVIITITTSGWTWLSDTMNIKRLTDKEFWSYDTDNEETTYFKAKE